MARAACLRTAGTSWCSRAARERARAGPAWFAPLLAALRSGPRRHGERARARRGRPRIETARSRPAPLLAPAARAREPCTSLSAPTRRRDRRALIAAGLHPVLARVYAARRIRSAAELDDDFKRLLPPASLTHCERAAGLLADAIAAGEEAAHRRGLRRRRGDRLRGRRARAAQMGANVEYLVPNRFELGYGLTPELVDIAAQRRPDLLITVDNGIASVEGVDARALSRHRHADHRPPPAGRGRCRAPNASSTRTSPAAASPPRRSPAWA